MNAHENGIFVLQGFGWFSTSCCYNPRRKGRNPVFMPGTVAQTTQRADRTTQSAKRSTSRRQGAGAHREKRDTQKEAGLAKAKFVSARLRLVFALGKSTTLQIC